MFDTAPSNALSNDVDEALKDKPGGGALDDDADPETKNRSGGVLPVSGGGEAEALPEAVATVIAKTGNTEDEKTKMDTFCGSMLAQGGHVRVACAGRHKYMCHDGQDRGTRHQH